MQAEAKTKDKLIAGILGGGSTLLGFLLLNALAFGFNIIFLILGLVFFLGGGYWLTTTLTRKLMFDGTFLERKGLFFTVYIVDVDKIEEFVDLNYSSDDYDQSLNNLSSFQITMRNGQERDLNLKGLDPEETLKILKEVIQVADLDYEFDIT